MTINVWIGLRDDAQAIIKTRLQWDEETDGPYNGPVTDRQARLFGYMADQVNTQRLWREASIGGRTWTVWNIYFDLPGNVLVQVKEELDQLAVDYPNHVVIAGAWRWTGEQLPDYPPHAQLIQFMPDVWNGDEPPTYSPATELTDINLGLGQSPRDFT